MTTLDKFFEKVEKNGVQGISHDAVPLNQNNADDFYTQALKKRLEEAAGTNDSEEALNFEVRFY